MLIIHFSYSCNERCECTNYWYKPSYNYCFTTIFIIICIRFFNILLFYKSRILFIYKFLSNVPSNFIITSIPKYCGYC